MTGQIQASKDQLFPSFSFRRFVFFLNVGRRREDFSGVGVGLKGRMKAFNWYILEGGLFAKGQFGSLSITLTKDKEGGVEWLGAGGREGGDLYTLTRAPHPHLLPLPNEKCRKLKDGSKTDQVQVRWGFLIWLCLLVAKTCIFKIKKGKELF